MPESIFDDLTFIKKRLIEISKVEKCEACDSTINITRRHRHTMYHFEGEYGAPDDPNFATFCEEHWKLDDEYYDGLWDEYYHSRL